jgi:hypothetical protein
MDGLRLVCDVQPFSLGRSNLVGSPLAWDAWDSEQIQPRVQPAVRPNRRTLEAEEFVRRVCELADFDFEYLASRARDRDTAEKRRLIATLRDERWRQKGSEIAAVLKKNLDVVSWWVGEGVRRRLEDEAFAAEIHRLDRGYLLC